MPVGTTMLLRRYERFEMAVETSKEQSRRPDNVVAKYNLTPPIYGSETGWRKRRRSKVSRR